MLNILKGKLVLCYTFVIISNITLRFVRILERKYVNKATSDEYDTQKRGQRVERMRS